MVDLRGEIETVNSKSEEEDECVGEDGRVWDLGILWWFLAEEQIGQLRLVLFTLIISARHIFRLS